MLLVAAFVAAWKCPAIQKCPLWFFSSCSRVFEARWQCTLFSSFLLSLLIFRFPFSSSFVFWPSAPWFGHNFQWHIAVVERQKVGCRSLLRRLTKLSLAPIVFLARTKLTAGHPWALRANTTVNTAMTGLRDSLIQKSTRSTSSPLIVRISCFAKKTKQ